MSENDGADKYMDVVRGLGTWGDLSALTRDRLARLLFKIGELRKVPQGQTWVKEGDHDDTRGYILCRGSVAIAREENQPGVTCEAPTILGEMMQFNPRENRFATVTATSKCTVLRFKWTDFWNAIDEEFGESERAAVRETLERFAWSRFMSWS
jgi:CRP-like cAMP-binding protein